MIEAINYDSIYAMAEELRESYRTADPFPHIIIENPVNPDYLDLVLEQFPGQNELEHWRRNVVEQDDTAMQVGKLGFSKEHIMSGVIRNLLWEMNDGPFLYFLERLTGIENLISDPMLRGGGMHQIEPGGVLGVHADFTSHPFYHLDRRLNLLLFLNKNWHDDFAGHLELWSTDLSRCVKSIRPSFGRMVIFSTSADSFHGHPQVLNCPQGITRKSIALYYYTNGRPETDIVRTIDTDWRNLPEVDRPPHQ